MRKITQIMYRPKRGRYPINRYDDERKPGSPLGALNSIYINNGFVPKSDRIKVTIEEIKSAA